MTKVSVELDKELVEIARLKSKSLNQTISQQIEVWATVGQILEENPDLTYEFVKDAIRSNTQKSLGQLEPFSFG
ncbi:MAG: hypothetical protein GJ680_21210 [Alteromonadaceae bacterium]|nr:hypothetical protein [Alteromonadaceae bacterium]